MPAVDASRAWRTMEVTWRRVTVWGGRMHPFAIRPARRRFVEVADIECTQEGAECFTRRTVSSPVSLGVYISRRPIWMRSR